MPTQDLPPRYHAYLLRFWEVRGSQDTDDIKWRFSLEDPRSGERVGFSDLESLRAFLEAQVDQRNGNNTK